MWRKHYITHHIYYSLAQLDDCMRHSTCLNTVYLPWASMLISRPGMACLLIYSLTNVDCSLTCDGSLLTQAKISHLLLQSLFEAWWHLKTTAAILISYVAIVISINWILTCAPWTFLISLSNIWVAMIHFVCVCVCLVSQKVGPTVYTLFFQIFLMIFITRQTCNLIQSNGALQLVSYC